MMGTIQADQDTSFQAMDGILRTDDQYRRRRPGGGYRRRIHGRADSHEHGAHVHFA